MLFDIEVLTEDLPAVDTEIELEADSMPLLVLQLEPVV